MTERFLVCPPVPQLFRNLGSSPGIVLRVDGMGMAKEAVKAIREVGVHLHCVWIRQNSPLASCRFDPSWDDLPIALYAPEIGRLRDIVRHVSRLRHMNLRIYLPRTPENLSSIRVLSSLGVETALLLNGTAEDWDKVADLMTYALFGKAQHAAIGPFSYMIGRYRASARNDFGQFYFDDPSVYLHLDRDGQVALTSEDCSAGRFIARSLEALGDLERNEAYQAYRQGWLDIFLRADGCSRCPAWRLCLGRFGGQGQCDRGCEAFFTEWMDALEEYRGNDTPVRQTWQP